MRRISVICQVNKYIEHCRHPTTASKDAVAEALRNVRALTQHYSLNPPKLPSRNAKLSDEIPHSFNLRT